ncbi:N-acetyl-alpha-D-glucosaminyl L-malate synthase OS=Lysinibacillus sphaericus OX=1421 GN=bshA_1 PE=4 SV=1 [Lysinibacillus sphaericus]
MKDVLFLGKQENLAELYAISDLKLLLSQQESFGLVLLEAMACGVPCIGSNVGGIPEVIDHGVDGYLVELGDTDAVAEYAVELLNDEDKLLRFREAAMRAVNEKFHSSKIVEQYEQLYEKVAEINHAKH